MLSAACSLGQCLHDVVSHTVSAGLFLRVQVNLEADKGLHMLWLLFLTPGPSRIMKLISLQHQHNHDQASLMTATVKTMVSVLQAARAHHALSLSLLVAKNSSVQWSYESAHHAAQQR